MVQLEGTREPIRRRACGTSRNREAMRDYSRSRSEPCADCRVYSGSIARLRGASGSDQPFQASSMWSITSSLPRPGRPADQAGRPWSQTDLVPNKTWEVSETGSVCQPVSDWMAILSPFGLSSSPAVASTRRAVGLPGGQGDDMRFVQSSDVASHSEEWLKLTTSEEERHRK